MSLRIYHPNQSDEPVVVTGIGLLAANGGSREEFGMRRVAVNLASASRRKTAAYLTIFRWPHR